MDSVKIPPQDLEAEKSVLGSIMIDKNAVIKVADSIIPSDFYASANQKIYGAILDLFSKNEPIDILSVSNILKSKKELDSIGGNSYLGDMINSVPSSAHVAHYAKIVREKRILRDLISLAADINEDVFEKKAGLDILIDSVEQKIFKVSQRSQDKNLTALKDELKEAYERIEKLHQGEKGLLRGVTTGFEDLDKLLSGLQRSDMVILGARPSLGKTTLALDIARGAALKGGASVGIFSLEMSREQLVDRLIAAEAQVPFWRLRTGQLNNESDFVLIQEALDRLSRMKIFIDDTPSPSIMQIRSIARRLQTEQGLDLIVVDYVQLIQPMTQTENMVQQFTEISHGIKSLARELNIPVLAVSQLNRQVDAREVKVPRLSDLRETGSWEQDADVVMLIYRKDRDKLEPSLEEQDTASIIIAKHRNGPLGTVDLKFDGDKVTFRPIAKTHTTSYE